MRLRTAALTAAALAVGAVLTLLVPASPAVGYFSPPLLLDIRVGPTANIVAKGAAVETRLEVTCAGAPEANVNVEITQRAGSEIATGYASTWIGCTGERHTLLLVVSAEAGKAFKQGPAVARAVIYSCYYVCGSEDDTQTIELVK